MTTCIPKIRGESGACCRSVAFEAPYYGCGGDCRAWLHIPISDHQTRHLAISGNPDQGSMVPRATIEGLQADPSRVFEARADYATLGIRQGNRLELQIPLCGDGLPLQVAPQTEST